MNSQHDAAPEPVSDQTPEPSGGTGGEEFPGAPRWAKVLGTVLVSALVVAGVLENTLGAAAMAGH
ncbi:MAG: hypothetical protein M3Z25_02395 [Actinomycetota bacterium]|nr:hypothetical protein [Actinomycetota bacterium]